MGITIIVCDNDKISLKINTTYAEEFCQKYKVKANIHSFDVVNTELITFIKTNHIDIAFLEIALNNMDGISLAKEIQKKNPWVSIIFITDHSEYALEAYNILANGYIKKPIKQIRLEKLFTRAVIQAQSLRNKKIGASLDLTVNKISITLRQSSIIYLQKIQQKTRIVTQSKTYDVYETLTSVEARLEYIFLKISQSTIVNMNEIISFEHNEIHLTTGEVFKVGRTYLKIAHEVYANFPQKSTNLY